MRIIRIQTLFIVIALCLPWNPLFAQEGQFVDGIAAIVNGQAITFSDVKQISNPIEKTLEASESGAQLRQDKKEQRLKALNTLIDNELIVQEFENNQYSIPSSTIYDALQEYIKTSYHGDQQAFASSLQGMGLSLEEYRTDFKRNMILKAMRGHYVDQVVTQKLTEKGLDESTLSKTPSGQAIINQVRNDVETSWLNGLRAGAYIKVF